MTMDNPFPSQFPPPPKKAKPKIGLNVCFESCPIFTVGSLITLAFVTFDIVTDWLLWRRLSLLWIHDIYHDHHDEFDGNGCQGHTHADPLATHVREFPQFFFYFVTIATVVYALQVIIVCTRFGVERCRYRSKLDGLPTEPSTFEVCSRDIIISLQVVFQDLSLSALLFYVQLNISCDFYLIFYNDSIVILSLSATICCLFWRFVQTIWHWGCCGARYDYQSGICVNVIRSCNIVLLFVVLFFVVVNFILITPGSIDQRHSSEFSKKTVIDKWVNEQYIYISIVGDEFVCDNETMMETNETDIIFKHHRTYSESYHELVPLRSVLTREHSGAQMDVPLNDTAWMSLLGNGYIPGVSPHNTDSLQCTVSSSFKSSRNLHRIDFNFGYHCTGSRGDVCYRNILPRMFYEYTNGTVLQVSTQRLSNNRSASNKNSSSEYIVYSREQFRGNEGPNIIRQLRPVLTLIQGKSNNVICDMTLQLNESLQLQANQC